MKLAERFFPYPKFRPFQRRAIKFAYNIITSRRVGLLSSPCGTGKSISVLTAFFAAEQQQPIGRLLALTRTRNQLEIYSREMKRIKEHSGTTFAASIFESKKEMCPHVEKESKLKDASYQDFLYYCKNLKKGTFGQTCEYYDRTYYRWRPSWRSKKAVERIKQMGPLLPQEVYKVCLDHKLCPHEITKILARHADILVGNYNYVLMPQVRKAIIGRMGARLDEVNCVFDEAHALPRYAAGLLSDELSTISLSRAVKEVEEFDVEGLGLLEALHDIAEELGEQTYQRFGFDEEHLIDMGEVIGPLNETLGIRTEELLENLSNLSEDGEVIRRRRAEKGKRPVSYLSRCSSFFTNWITTAGPSYAHYVKATMAREKESRAKIGLRCMDPAIAAKVMNRLRSVILMSGTLWHPEYYIDTLGIERDRSQTMQLPTPFPPENRLILVDKRVTTKFEKRGEEQWRKIADHLQRMVDAAGGRVAVYFPSYDVMDAVLKYAGLKVPLLAEGGIRVFWASSNS